MVRGWKQALAALKIPLEKSVHEDSAKQDNGDRAKHFDRRPGAAAGDGTTAMLVHSDTQAVAFVQHCVDRGVDVPGSMAIVGYDDEVAYLAEPAISAVRPPKQLRRQGGGAAHGGPPGRGKDASCAPDRPEPGADCARFVRWVRHGGSPELLLEDSL